MMRSLKFSTSKHLLLCKIILILCILSDTVLGYKVGNDPFHRAAYLDPQQKYHLEWFVNQNTSRITFSLKVQTKGWILFGLANNAGELEQDVVVGGVLQNGKPYLSDRHRDNCTDHPKPDITQDYILESFWEKRGCTFLQFSRDLDTCDYEDHKITQDRITIIWAYGNDDNMNGNLIKNSVDSGSYNNYLLDPEYTPSPVDIRLNTSIKTWTLSSRLVIPSSETSYLCTIRKAPKLTRKHHMIGFNVKFDNEQSRNLSHHFNLQRCRAPKGMSANFLFGTFAKSGEYQACYNNYLPATGKMPLHFCTQYYFLWGQGGREFFLPDHVGMPFNDEDSSQDEYYMIQAHYNNQEQLSDISVGFQIEVFYTQNLRKNDGGLMIIGHDIPGLPESYLIPPKTSEIQMYGHCSGECTQRMLPKEGMTFVGGVLHSHNSGMKMKLHHFRGKKELPWILYDDNYNSSFQQNRGLARGEVEILPGDHLITECTYDNTWTNGTVVGGFRTSQEMCTAIMFFYSSLPEYSFCGSTINSPYLRERFLGVRNVTWWESLLDWVADFPSPRNLIGRTITDISDNLVEWTRERRDELQEVYQKFPQVGSCKTDVFSRDPVDIRKWLRDNSPRRELRMSGGIPTYLNTKDEFSGPVEYPREATPYFITENSCMRSGGLLK